MQLTHVRHATFVAGAIAIAIVFRLSNQPRADAAQHVAIHGVTGTWALPGNVDKIYDGVNTLIVTTTDGVRHTVHVNDGTKVHGADTLANLPRGTAVVVHYTVKGEHQTADEIDSLGGLSQIDGTVAAVDRVDKVLTVKYTGGKIERLKLTRHALDESGNLKGNRVIVYYASESGQKVAHYFKRKS
jgi:hypothetical protein